MEPHLVVLIPVHQQQMCASRHSVSLFQSNGSSASGFPPTHQRLFISHHALTKICSDHNTTRELFHDSLEHYSQFAASTTDVQYTFARSCVQKVENGCGIDRRIDKGRCLVVQWCRPPTGISLVSVGFALSNLLMFWHSFDALPSRSVRVLMALIWWYTSSAE